MFTQRQEEIMQQACGEYGREQIIVAMEELAELSKELAKAHRGIWSSRNTTEEIADVYIMLYQMQYFLSISDRSIQTVIDYKLKRLESQLENPF